MTRRTHSSTSLSVSVGLPQLAPVLLRVLLLALVFYSSPVVCEISPSEEVFLSLPDASSARRHLHHITSESHVAGTPGDHRMAAYVLEHFQAAGIPDASIFELDVLLNYPTTPPQVSLVSRSDHSRTVFRAHLSEDVLYFDSTSGISSWRNHTFHGYSPSGNIIAPLVYANYGRPEDFDRLEQAGVDVQDTIVLMRYGQCFRGLKVMNAQARGAAGVILYSDPFEDGDHQGSVYPDGPWRPMHGVQRGSVQFNSKCGGDPLRADKRYGHVTVQDLCGVEHYTDLIPTIPSVPMSYGDAKALLDHRHNDMGGPPASEVFEKFEGGLEVEYRVGPSLEMLVHLQVENEFEIRGIPNVVGRIPGSLPPEQDMPVLLGNHRDAWVFGAADPNSGTACLLEVARGLGALLDTGWQPLHTIYLLSWSGEEYGLLGSTGWGELNALALSRAAAYLNVDTAVSGDLLSVALTPALSSVWKRVLHDLSVNPHHRVKELVQNGPVGDVRDANTNWRLHHHDDKEELLGSGSDYTVFLDHLGIASLDFRLEKTTLYGQYHSIYDSFSWMDAYGGKDDQPGSSFELMALASKIWGLLALRLADPDGALPLDHVVQGEALSHYVDAIEQQGVGLDLDALKMAVQKYQEAASDIETACQKSPLSSALNRQTCNEKLGLTERQFLASEGLPDRPWFKHILQAPGMYLGYAAEAFPGVQQAIDDGNLRLAQQQVDVAAERVKAAALFLSPTSQPEVAAAGVASLN